MLIRAGPDYPHFNGTVNMLNLYQNATALKKYTSPIRVLSVLVQIRVDGAVTSGKSAGRLRSSGRRETIPEVRCDRATRAYLYAGAARVRRSTESGGWCHPTRHFSLS